MAKKSTMRRGQMIAIAALFTSAVAPYAVSADTVTTTSTEVDNTAVETSKYVEKGVDFQFSTGKSLDDVQSTDSYFKGNFVGNVDLEISKDANYALVSFIGHSYGYEKFTNADGSEATIVSESGTAGTKDYVRVVRVALDDKYQAVVFGNSSTKGNTQFNFDLSQEKFNFEYSSPMDSYFKAWLPNADVVTLKNGKKVAYVTIAGHSYAAEAIYEGNDTSKLATIVKSTGTKDTKDLARTVRLELDENNKAAVFIPDSRMDAAISFDFTEKEAVADFVTVADLSETAKALTPTYTAVDTAAGSWHPMAFPSAALNPTAKAVNGKIEVSYDLKNVKSFKATQNGQEIAVTVADDKATFTVDKLDGIAFEVAATAERNGVASDVTYKVNLVKALLAEETGTPVQPTQPGTTTPDTSEPVVTPDPASSDIPTTIVEGKPAKVTFKTTPAAMDWYFQGGGFFGDVEIVEINGQSYADLTIIEKSIGLDYNYIMPNGTVAKVAEISGNRETQNGEYHGFEAVVRIPVEVSETGNFEFTLDTFGGQPGTDSQAAYQFTFTGKIQVNVPVNFTDVKNADTQKYVQQLANWGALNLKLTTFNPGSDITRAQFSLMIARALKLEATKAVEFSDVKTLKDAETKSAIQALYEAGVVTGSNGKFKPNDKITRQQAAVMIYRLMTKQLGYKATATASDLNFNDADDIKGEEAKKAFAELQKAKVMSGTNGFINPSSKLKRSQMAKILVESLNKAGFEQ